MHFSCSSCNHWCLSLVLLATISAFEGHQLGMLVAGTAPRGVERLPGSITAMNVESRWLEIPLKLSPNKVVKVVENTFKNFFQHYYGSHGG